MTACVGTGSAGASGCMTGSRAEVLWAVKDDAHRHFLVLGAVGCVLETFIPGMRAMRVAQAERAARKAWTH